MSSEHNNHKTASGTENNKDSRSNSSEEHSLSWSKRLYGHIQTIWRIEFDLPKGMLSRQVVVVLFLMICICLSSIAVVYSSHTSRQLFHELTEMKEERQDLQTEWGQLLLEQSALSSHTRVENLAAKKLEMQIPAAEDIKLVIERGR